MFCSNCGTQIQDGERFCPNCGTPVGGNPDIKRFIPGEMNGNLGGSDMSGMSENAGAGGNGGYGAAGQFDGNTGYDGGNGAYSGVQGSYNGPTGPVLPLRTDRSLLIYILLTVVTCGIYGLIFLYLLIQDVNTACNGDGEETPGFLLYLILSICTCGIYSFIWYYKLGNRLANNCRRYGYTVSEDGITVLLWMIFGYFLCGIGPFIAMNIIINQTNDVCMGYNRANGMA